VFKRFMGESFKAFKRFASGTGAFLKGMGALVHTGFEVMWDLGKSATKAGLNGILSMVESGVNRAIEMLNKVPGTNIGKVSFGSFERESFGSIKRRGAQRLRRRWQRIRQRDKMVKRNNAARTVQLSPPGTDQPQRPRPARGPRPTSHMGGGDDNSTTVEELRVVLQSTGDGQLDGEQVGQAAMQYIEEQQQRRQ